MAGLWETSKRNVFHNPVYPKQERQLACASSGKPPSSSLSLPSPRSLFLSSFSSSPKAAPDL